MKKIVLMVIVLMGVTFMSQEVQAQENKSVSKSETEQQDDFYEIEQKDISSVLQDALNKAYEGCLLKSVFVSNNSTYVKYKVILTTREQQTLKVYLDDKGQVVKEHPYFI